MVKTIEELVKDELLKGWCSNLKLCYLVRSASAPRACRKLREKQKVDERVRHENIGGRNVTYKEWRIPFMQQNLFKEV
jgi:hypothetical protein